MASIRARSKTAQDGGFVGAELSRIGSIISKVMGLSDVQTSPPAGGHSTTENSLYLGWMGRRNIHTVVLFVDQYAVAAFVRRLRGVRFSGGVSLMLMCLL